jgi:hypothetical protein
MVGRIMVAGAVIMAMLLWLGPFPVPNWAVIAFLFVVLVPMGILLSAKRMRQESRMARSIWQALTRR